MNLSQSSLVFFFHTFHQTTVSGTRFLMAGCRFCHVLSLPATGLLKEGAVRMTPMPYYFVLG